jgi:recombination protein RecT
MGDDAMTKELTFPQELGHRKHQFQAALPPQIPVDRFVRVVMTAIQRNPELLNCDRRSLWNACMQAAQDGLVPDGRQGALVAFDGKVTWVPMVQGIMIKARNSGEIAKWELGEVHAKDQFDFQLGDDPFVAHKPWIPTPLTRMSDEADEQFGERLRAHANPGEVTHFYSIVTFTNGLKSRDVMAAQEVEYVRDTYARKSKKTGQFSPAWVKRFGEMGKKTVARRHAKTLPASTDLIALLQRDDTLYNVDGSDRATGATTKIAAPKALSDRLDFLAGGFDPETGEIDSGGGLSTPDPQNGAASVSRSAEAAPLYSDDEPFAGPPPDAELEASPASREASSPAPSSAGEISPSPPGPPAETAPEARQASGARKMKELPLKERGEAMAKKGRKAFSRWLDSLEGDDLVQISLAQQKAWYDIADAEDKQ